MVSQRPAVPSSHFPNTLHAVVWRNWGLVSAERLAEVLETTADKVADIAASMGLPRNVQVPADFKERGYITLIRRNWHLLPVEQLLQLLDISTEQFAFRLREDDFLYVKLGPKPRCDRVQYSEPNAAIRQRAAEIKKIVECEFGDRLNQPGDPRFGFVTALSQPDRQRDSPVKTPLAAKSLRVVYSYFSVYGDPLSNSALDPYPDGLLSRLRDRGVNGVWLHVVLRQMAPGGPTFPEFGDGCEERLANLRKLVDRCKRFGIDVYLYLNEPRAMPSSFFEHRPEMAGVREGDYTAMCTSDPRVRQWVSESLTHIFREVPGLGGVFTITASENLTSCASHGNSVACPRCGQRSGSDVLAQINAAIEEGVHQTAPDAKVIVWDWGWNDFRADTADIIPRLPKSVWLMSVSEWDTPIERGGVKSTVAEYSLSAIGPGPRATQNWLLAKKCGLKTVAKVQFNNSWELSTVPYLPVMDLVAEHCQGLAKFGVDGLMLSWSLGGYPSLNLEVADEFSQNPSANSEAVLQTVAERHFGTAAAPLVRQAWAKFSQAFREFPMDSTVLYRAPQQMGPANLLFASSTGYKSTMVGFPYDDLQGWCGPYPAQTLATQFKKVADGWAEGLVDLEAAQSMVPNNLRSDAAADLRVAQAAQIHFASAGNQVEFVLARDKSINATEVAEKERLRRELLRILDREIELAKRLYGLATADSRLGYEASNHYFYVPLDLVEKVVNCVQLRAHYEDAK